jgi:hypothetical protein
MIEILTDNMTEKDAFELEEQLICSIKSAGGSLTNLTNGGDCGPRRYGERDEKFKNKVSIMTKLSMSSSLVKAKHLQACRSDENRKKLSEIQKTRIHKNAEWFNNFTKSNLNTNYRNKKVVREDGVIFNSALDVASFYRTKLSVIVRHLSGKRKTYKGQVFKYL